MTAYLNLPLLYSVLRENSFLWAFQWLCLFSKFPERSILLLLLFDMKVRLNQQFKGYFNTVIELMHSF